MTPDKFTNQHFFLDVSHGHKLYVYDWGKSDAKLPIIFLHGGPGSGNNDSHKQRFDPSRQRVIFFDQRGAGKSLPKGSLRANTTTEAIEDIEQIANHLKLKRFILSGGSWGSCLALAYALKYPGRIQAMVLSGIFCASRAEIGYIDNGHFQNFFPDVWQQYLDRTPQKHLKNPSQYHYRQALGKNSQAAKKSAYAYSELENALVALDDRPRTQNFDEFDPSSTIIELYYLKHGCFLKEGYILDNAPKLTMPIWLVQGRYDMVCPPQTAFRLNKGLANGQLIWTTAGHGNDRPTYDVVRTLLLQISAQP
ncbi:MAG TPA: alpha/beta fold hydrolase [Candidatus Dormibacteraeota bacterium]|nr:alpha/beta fold hydrolase [Candidatus Dormibacteraeota bacterium]